MNKSAVLISTKTSSFGKLRSRQLTSGVFACTRITGRSKCFLAARFATDYILAHPADFRTPIDGQLIRLAAATSFGCFDLGS